MSTILVTGGLGFIGSWIVEYYVRSDNKIIVVDNLIRAKLYNLPNKAINYRLEQIKKSENVIVRSVDIRNHEKLNEILRKEKVDIIFHTAAQVAVTTSLINPRLDFEINVLGTFNILELARKHDAIVVYASTNKVYGENVNKIPLIEKKNRYEYADPKYKEGIPEDFPIDLTGHTPYGCSKLSADLYVQDYYHTYGLKTGVFRMSCIYGEGQFGVEDQGWVAWFIIATLTNKIITIYGNGKQVRDILHVQDLIKAYDLFIKSKDVKHGVYNIGGGPQNTISLLELIGLLEEITGRRVKVKFSNWRPKDQKVYVSCINKIKKELKWRPEINIRKGITRLIDWVNGNKYLFT